jgi:hypothetical protein
MSTPRREYQSKYWRANKAALLTQRKIHRHSKTEEELQAERAKARKRDKRKRERIAALIAAAERLVVTLDIIQNASAPDASEVDKMEFSND